MTADHLAPVRLSDRFWAHVEKSVSCWLWRGPTWSDGRGFLISGDPPRQMGARRLSWSLHYGPPPEGKPIFVSCGLSACVRPDHLTDEMPPAIRRRIRDRMRTILPRFPVRVRRGERHPRSKVNEAEVISLVERFYSGVDIPTLAKSSPLSRSSVAQIVYGYNWAWLTGITPAARGLRRYQHLGQANGNAILTETSALEIIHRFEAGEGPSAIARSLGVAYSTVNSVVTGRNWGWATGRPRCTMRQCLRQRSAAPVLDVPADEVNRSWQWQGRQENISAQA